MDKKRCYKCKKAKSVNDFYKCIGSSDGLQYKCKSCVKEYYNKNKSKINEYKKHYRKNNKEKIAEGKKRYYSIKDNMDQKKKHDAEYYEKNRDTILNRMSMNKDKILKYVNRRRASDINFRLAQYLRNRVRTALKNNQKSGSAVADLGCSIENLKEHIERQFVDGMSWDNWGKNRGCWSIDHIIPLSRPNLSNRKEFLKVAHYTNLRPMWHIDNIKKSDKIEDYSDPGVFVKPA